MNKRLNFTTELFIQEAIAIHNNYYIYNKVNFTRMIDHVIIICPIHGEFTQAARSHLDGHKCQKCRGLNFPYATKFSQEDILIRFDNKYNGRFDYSKVVYSGIDKEVEIICKIHGLFLQSPWNHLLHSGCRECSGKLQHTTDSFITKSNIIHNNKYTYNNVIYINAYEYVMITCRIHGDFPQSPTSHFSGSGCPKCVSSISKAETKWLNTINIEEKYHHKTLRINGRIFHVDAFDSKTNTVYEFYGDYYHGNPQIYDSDTINPTTKQTYGFLYQRTLNREQMIKSGGFNFISIWENDYNKLYKSNSGNSFGYGGPPI